MRVLFICHGNICRSPMAEYVFADLVRQRGLSDQFEIASAATSTEEIGNDVYPPARKTLRAHGVPCPSRQARQTTRGDAEYYDYLVVMDSRNVTNLQRLLGSTAEGKVHKLLEFAGMSRDVSDPWYTRDFETCYNDVVAGCTGLLTYLGF